MSAGPMSAGPISAGPEALERLPRAARAIEEGRAQGLHLGGELYVSLRGEVVADTACGEDSPDRPLASRALMLWLSSTKPVTAVALGQLWEQGRLDLDDPLADHVPEFAAGGKEAITLRHALTHTGGFRMLDVGYPRLTWEETIARICAARREPRWVPGAKAGYHQDSSWFILGEVVRRLSGRPFERAVRETIFEPLGMVDSWIGMPAERFAAERDRIATCWDTSTSPPKRLPWDDELHCTRCSPAGGGRGPMAELGRFYEMLLGRGRLGGATILRPQTVEALTARHRVGMYDHTFKHVLDWGLGFIPDSKQYGDDVPYAYGRLCSRRTYGHSGYRSSTAFADPEHGLAVALAFNGLPSDADHAARIRAVVEGIYKDLGIAAPDQEGLETRTGA